MLVKLFEGFFYEVAIIHLCVWLLMIVNINRRFMVYALFLFNTTSQVSRTHTAGLAQDKTKIFHPEKAVRQAPKGTASFTLHTAQSIIWGLLEEPVAEILCLVWHLVVEICILATKTVHLFLTVMMTFYDGIKVMVLNTFCGYFYNMSNGWA